MKIICTPKDFDKISSCSGIRPFKSEYCYSGARNPVVMNMKVILLSLSLALVPGVPGPENIKNVSVTVFPETIL